MNSKTEKSRGFTLVELLVVVAIISVLAGLLMPALEDAISMTRQIACMNSQRQFFLYITAYQEDNNNYYPQSYMWWGTDATVSNNSGGYGEWITGILPYMDMTPAEGAAKLGPTQPGDGNMLVCPAVKYPGHPTLENTPEFRAKGVTYGGSYVGTSDYFIWVGNYRISGYFGYWFPMNPTMPALVKVCKPKRQLSNAVAPSNRILMGECNSEHWYSCTDYGYDNRPWYAAVIHNENTSTNHLYCDGHVATYFKAPYAGLNLSEYPNIRFFDSSELP